MKLRVFASGSDGNSLAVRSRGGALLLVDLGLSCLELTRRAKDCEVDLATAAGVLFTHDHSDHYSALAVFHKRNPHVPLFANGDTADALAAKTGVADGWNVFETSESFEVADFTITSFSTSHDAADPVGYLIDDGASVLFVGTDTGVATMGFKAAFARANCAVLESNHDPVLLETSNRPPDLKRRISGRSGHLSNDDVAVLLRAGVPAGLRVLLLAHLSDECNTPSLALQNARDALVAANRPDVTLQVLSQSTPSAVFAF